MRLSCKDFKIKKKKIVEENCKTLIYLCVCVCFGQYIKLSFH